MTTSLRHLLASAVVVIAGTATVSAFAQTPPPAGSGTPGTATAGPRKAKPRIKDLDTNKDNIISRDEAKGRPRLAKNFDAIDTNKDGQLTRDEMKAYRQAHKRDRK